MAIHQLQSTRLRVSGAILVLVLTTAASARAQTNATWNGPSGNWTNAAIWSTNPLYPNNGNPGGSTYNAILTGNSSTITLDANITIEQLQFNTGTLAGTNTLTLNQLFTWGNGSADSGGTLFGAGTLNANGGVSFNGASLMSILNGWTLNLNANSNWSNGNITVNGSVTQGSSLTIASGVTLTATGNNSLVQTTGFISSFTNLGTFRKMTGTGTTSIGGLLPFTNTGAVDVQSGTLLIIGGGTNTGSFNVASGATLQFAAGPGADTFNINAGPGITGSGATTINMPTVNINVASYPIATALNLVAGSLAGSGSATVSGLFTFSGGTVNNTVNANGGSLFTGTDIKTVDNGGILNLNSATTWDNGTIRLNGGGTLSIASGVTMSATGNNQIDRTGGAVSSFANAGTFRKMTGTGTTTITNTVPFTNTGTVDVQSGILSINGGGTSTGSFNVSSGATLQFGAGSGAGTFNINAGPGITGSGATTVNTATVNINVASYPIATALNLVAGTLGGTGPAQVNGLFTFLGGNVTGLVSANGGGQFTGTDIKTVDNGGILNLNSASTWDNGTIRLNGGGTLSIASGATMSATGNNQIERTGGAVSSFANAGTFRKMTGTGTTTIANTVPFTNTGAVDVQSGILSINGGGTSTGSFNVSSSATLQFGAGPGAGTFNINSGPGITGSGATTINTATVNVNAASYPIATALNLVAGTLGGTGTTQANGVLTFTGGIVSGAVNGNGGVLFTGSTGKFINTGGLLNVQSNSTWDAGNIMLNGGTLSIGSSATLTATGNDTLTRTASGVGTFSNAGTFRKITGTGTTTVSFISFNNTGTVDVQTGTLALNSGLTNNGTFQVAAGATSTGIVTSSGSGSIVRGRGTVDTLVMNDLSTLSPGFSPGKLTATGNVTMNSGSTYFVELTSNVPDTGYDVLAVAGTVNLNNPTLSVSLNYAPAPSDVFTIITAGSIPTGNIFAGYANGSLVPLGNGYTATIEYGSTFVRLVNPVPEATDILLVCSAATLAITFWRRFGLAG